MTPEEALHLEAFMNRRMGYLAMKQLDAHKWSLRYDIARLLSQGHEMDFTVGWPHHLGMISDPGLPDLPFRIPWISVAEFVT